MRTFLNNEACLNLVPLARRLLCLRTSSQLINTTRLVGGKKSQLIRGFFRTRDSTDKVIRRSAFGNAVSITSDCSVQLPKS